jgi:glycine/D-amino acid oxidase-like deaminating enzyme
MLALKTHCDQHLNLFLLSTDSLLTHATTSQWLKIAAQHGLDSRLLSTKELSGLIQQGSNSKHRWIASLHTPSDGRAEPWQAVPAVAELAQSEGVNIREDCAVRSLDIQGGQVVGVFTESGRTKCGCAVVLAGGAWSSLFLRHHGIDIPQLLVRGTVARTVPLPEVLAGNAIDEELAFRRRQDGRYSLAGHNTFHFIGPDSFRHIFNYLPLLKSFPDITLMPSTFLTPDSWTIKRNWLENEVSPFEITRVLDPPPDSSTVRKLERLFKIRFPDLNVNSTNLIEHAWGGMIDTMPDIVPIVDTAPTMKGLVIATGMSAHGFGIGPSYGKAISDIVTGTKVGHDLSRFRFRRFTDGSKLSPGPSL